MKSKSEGIWCTINIGGQTWSIKWNLVTCFGYNLDTNNKKILTKLVCFVPFSFLLVISTKGFSVSIVRIFVIMKYHYIIYSATCDQALNLSYQPEFQCITGQPWYFSFICNSSKSKVISQIQKYLLIRILFKYFQIILHLPWK